MRAQVESWKKRLEKHDLAVNNDRGGSGASRRADYAGTNVTITSMTTLVEDYGRWSGGDNSEGGDDDKNQWSILTPQWKRVIFLDKSFATHCRNPKWRNALCALDCQNRWWIESTKQAADVRQQYASIMATWFGVGTFLHKVQREAGWTESTVSAWLLQALALDPLRPPTNALAIRRRLLTDLDGALVLSASSSSSPSISSSSSSSSSSISSSSSSSSTPPASPPQYRASEHARRVSVILLDDDDAEMTASNSSSGVTSLTPFTTPPRQQQQKRLDPPSRNGSSSSSSSSSSPATRLFADDDDKHAVPHICCKCNAAIPDSIWDSRFVQTLFNCGHPLCNPCAEKYFVAFQQLASPLSPFMTGCPVCPCKMYVVQRQLDFSASSSSSSGFSSSSKSTSPLKKKTKTG